MTRFIKATYHADLQVAEFVTDDGRHVLRSGGTLPWRINNCGDLVSPVIDRKPAPKKTKNYIGFATVPRQSGGEYNFFIFPDYETGRAELCASLKRKHADDTIPQLVPKYAPSTDNDTARYTVQLLQETGLPADKKVSAMTDDELARLAAGIQKLEGYENNAETRREVWVPVSRINATDGARPIVGAELTLRSGSKQQTIKSNHVGQFPPIPHVGGPIQVLHRDANGELKQVGEIGGDKGQVFNLEVMLERFFGFSRSDSPPAAQTPAKRREPLIYQVQPGDTLSSIAEKFHTTVTKLQQTNALRSDKIFAGQKLGIGGPATPLRRASKSLPPSQEHASTSTPGSPKKAPSASVAAKATRTHEGAGKPLAVVPAEGRHAPWMAFAVDEAKHFKGASEDVIEKQRNYATEVRTGQNTIIGNSHPWCAAFVNWCLMKAGYPIDNPTFYDHVGAKGRAHAFFEVQENKNDKHMVRNPLYVEIEKPIFGAIAMVTSSSGHGHHVGFVYARHGEKLVLLGGNQSNEINFSEFYEKPTTYNKRKVVKGKTVTMSVQSDKLRFFAPASYATQAKADQVISLDETSAAQLNRALGISAGQGAASIL